MYIKKQLDKDTFLFRHLKDEDEKTSIHVQGTIRRAGLDYLELIQDDNRIISVFTNRIKQIDWIDPDCERVCIKCHQMNCRCVRFDRHCRRCHQLECNCHERKFDQFKQNDNIENYKKVCSVCHSARCKCLEKHIHHDDLREKNHYNSFEHKMKDNHCPHCHDDHRDYHHDSCPPEFVCICDYVIPFCDDRFELRLAGLTDNMNFEFFRHKGCKVKIELG